MRLENRTPDAPKRGRTKPCTEVADRAFPDVKLTDRNSVMVVVRLYDSVQTLSL